MISYKAPSYVVLTGSYLEPYSKPVVTCGWAKYATTTLEVVKEGDQHKEECFLFAELKKRGKSFTRKSSVLTTDSDEGLLNTSKHFIIPEIVTRIACLYEHVTGEPADKEICNQVTFSYLKKKYKLYGFETTACIYGGLIFFRREFPFLNYITPLGFHLPKSIEDTLSVNSELDTNSSNAQEVMKQFINKGGAESQKKLTEIERLSKQLVVAIVREGKKDFEECFAKINSIYVDLGLMQGLILRSQTTLSEDFKQDKTGLQKVS